MAAKVLVVDDSKFVRNQIGRALPAAEFAVVEAVDGMDALEKLAQHPDVCFVVCDVNMPRMDGLQFLESLRKQPQWQAVPVLMCTTEAHPDLVTSAAAFGARGWVVKPFKPEVLLEAVHKHMAKAA
jgi:two-component system chemotaxis response regulator CheY